MDKKSKKIRILFLYAGSNRLEYYRKWKAGLLPDTGLFGYNHLINFPGIEPEIGDVSIFLKARAAEPIRRLFGLKRQFYFFLPRILRSDIVFSPVRLNLLLLVSFLKPRVRWIVFNIHLTNLLRRHKRPKLILYALQRSAGIICLTASQKRFLEDEGIEKYKLAVIPFGVDCQFHIPSYKDDGYILSVGRDRGRDYQTLFKASAGLPIRVVVVCSRRNLANINDIPENVEVHYDLDALSLRDLYQKARLVVIPSYSSDYGEGSDCSGQTAILDAMATGKTVLASYREWMDGYLKNGENAVIIPPRDSQKMREAIEGLVNNKEKLLRIGQAARRSVEEKFNSRQFAEEIYKAAVNLNGDG